jgi:23S rRNA (adenine2503-C2)-methyltransferase
MPDRPHIFGLTPEALRDHLDSLGMPAFRAKQVLAWVYRHGVADPRQMTNLSAADRAKLVESLDFVQGTVLREQQATDGTRKLLIDWKGGGEGPGFRDQGSENNGGTRLPLIPDPRTLNPDSQTECVMIPAVSQDSGRQRRTACVSSQIGCPVGCRFCASGLGGLDGNLTAGQIVQQVWQLGQLPGVEGITNVVFMGMGEPLANFEAVTAATTIMMASWGPGISGRRITISTVGVPSGIRRLAEMDLPVTLAISLHAPNDEIRRQIIPWAKFVTIDQLVEAGRFYFECTGREITLEYILLGGLNDQPDHARQLARVAKRLRANINLIRYNEVKGLPFDRPATPDVQRFQAILRQAGVNTHIRASRGRDIAAACGQLRHEHQPEAPRPAAPHSAPT